MLYALLDYFGFVLGFLSLSKILLGFLECLYCLMLPTIKLKGWVCITGGSDGIGLGIAISLAKQGVNLILVSRNKEKLDQAKRILQDFHVDLAVIQADLASSDVRYLSSVIEKIRKFEVRGVINCAGVSYGSFFHLHNQADLINMLNLHTWPVVLFSKEFKDAWIVNVSSTASVAPSPILTIYSSTKAFIHNFTQVLASERGNILSFQCGFVDTEMTRSVKFKPYMIKSSEVSEYLLPCIGRVSATFGHWKHWFMGTCLKMLPLHFTTMKLLKIMKRKHKYN